MSTLRNKSTQDQRAPATAKAEKPIWSRSGEFTTEAEYWAEVQRLTQEWQQLHKEGWA